MRATASTYCGLLITLAACTKKNEEICCDSPASCELYGLDETDACDAGLVCRGNQCIAVLCESTSDCDLATPYCDATSGLCGETCTEDVQCPGLGDEPSAMLCESGACVECRTGAECSTAAPVCESNACRRCEADTECASGLCADDGTCTPPTAISYVAPAGSATSDCEQATPCSLARAVDIAASKPFVLLAAGNYTQSGSIQLGGTIAIVGSSAVPPTITNAIEGPVLNVPAGADVTLRNVAVVNAKGTALAGSGVRCTDATLRIVRSRFAGNETNGVNSVGCTISVLASEFTNSGAGMRIQAGVATVDRSTFSDCSVGLSLGEGDYSVTNSIVSRNFNVGLSLFPRVGNRFEFNTVVDNGRGISCDAGAAETFELANNLIARNGLAIDGAEFCTATTSVVSPTIAEFRFVRPDVAPYDYRITAGSSAIDQATGGTVAVDIDGDVRPQGAARDLGADEFAP